MTGSGLRMTGFGLKLTGFRLKLTGTGLILPPFGVRLTGSGSDILRKLGPHPESIKKTGPGSYLQKILQINIWNIFTLL